MTAREPRLARLLAYAVCTAACGDADSSSSSSTGLTPPMGECGNAILELGEDCDDGKNGEPDDGCTDACELPSCGDAFFQPSLGEQCDAGPDGDPFCSSTCTARLARAWLREFGTSESADDQANDVAIDGSGNVIAVGYVDSVGKGALGRDLWVRKYSPEGREVWTRTYDSELGSSNDYGNAVAATSAGDIYVGGDIPVEDQGHDGIVIAYDADGEVRWTIFHQGLAGNDDSVGAVAVSGDAVLVAGYEFAEVGVAASGWYSALDPADGGELWSGAVLSGPDDFAEIVDATVGPNGEWALSGVVDSDNWARVLEPDGGERFELVFDAVADDGSDVALGVAFTPEGDLLVAGSTTHAYVRRFDPDGAEVWSAVYANEEASGRDVTITTDGNIVLPGYVSSLGTSGSTPALYGAEPAAGALQWTQLVFDGGITGVALAAAAGPDGTLAVAGYHTPHAFEGSDLWVAYYAPLR